MSQYQYLNFLRRTNDNPVAELQHGLRVVLHRGHPHGQQRHHVHEHRSRSTAARATAAPAQLTFHHAGHANTLAVIDWMHKTFPVVPKLFVTGCSAGGAGAIVNYHFIRDGHGQQRRSAATCSTTPGRSSTATARRKQLHEKIRSAWNIDPVLDSAERQAADPRRRAQDRLRARERRDRPEVSRDDRLSLVAYQMDLNYSLYSYQRFFPGSTEAEIHAMLVAGHAGADDDVRRRAEPLLLPPVLPRRTTAATASRSRRSATRPRARST